MGKRFARHLTQALPNRTRPLANLGNAAQPLARPLEPRVMSELGEGILSSLREVSGNTQLEGSSIPGEV